MNYILASAFRGACQAVALCSAGFRHIRLFELLSGKYIIMKCPMAANHLDIHVRSTRKLINQHNTMGSEGFRRMRAGVSLLKSLRGPLYSM